MARFPTHHRMVFSIAGYSVFLTACMFFLIAYYYYDFTSRIYFLLSAFGATDESFTSMIIPTLIIVGGTIGFISIGLYYWKIGLLFFQGESEVWKAYSKLVYIDVVILVLIGFLLLLIISQQPFEYSTLQVPGIMYLCAFVLSLVSSGLSKENFYSAVALFLRNGIRMTVILLYASIIIAVTVTSGNKSYSSVLLVIIVSWSIIEGVAHMCASGILVHSSYIDQIQSRFEDDDYDDLLSHFPTQNAPTILSRRNTEELPDMNWLGEFRDDGFEWLEYPEDSDTWYWRDEDGSWVKYEAL